ncbi:MAG: DUF4142 domain-containing protein [Capsulimonas sp.]|uniref:DUF4142 domain-containing protein n=1 Tax=Capsulimonas sp. TaxID=2494211 RepID=UPI003264B6CE
MNRLSAAHRSLGVLALSIGAVIILGVNATARPPMVGSNDKKFVMKAAQGGAGEVMLGKLAIQNGSSPSVKAFGQHMVTDHSKANDTLKQTAARLGLSVPTTPGPEEKATYARLSKLHGAAFDSAYKKDMIEDHHKDISEFQKEASTGKMPTLMHFAATTLPTLKSHLQMAEQMTIGGKMAPMHGMKM